MRQRKNESFSAFASRLEVIRHTTGLVSRDDPGSYLATAAMWHGVQVDALGAVPPSVLAERLLEALGGASSDACQRLRAMPEYDEIARASRATCSGLLADFGHIVAVPLRRVRLVDLVYRCAPRRREFLSDLIGRAA